MNQYSLNKNTKKFKYFKKQNNKGLMVGSLDYIKNNYKKIHVIQNADSHAGFSAIITYALNGVRMAVENNWLPIVNYNKENLPEFYLDSMGEDIWDYYFFPVANQPISQVEKWLNQKDLANEFLHSYTDKEILDWHLEDPARIATFWSKKKPQSPTRWMLEKRALGRKYVSEYIKVKPHILEKVSQFQEKHFKNIHTIGVHLRGTDFSYAKPTLPKTYIEEIYKYLIEYQIKSFNIFIATDQKQFVQIFEEEFGEKIISYDAIRSDNHIAPFNMKNVNGYKKGEDVLIDMLLLSSCHFLFKGAAAVGEYALWFNPELPCHDFALESDFEQRKYSFRKGAFFQNEFDKNGKFLQSWKYYFQVIKQIFDEIKAFVIYKLKL